MSKQLSQRRLTEIWERFNCEPEMALVTYQTKSYWLLRGAAEGFEIRVILEVYPNGFTNVYFHVNESWWSYVTSIKIVPDSGEVEYGDLYARELINRVINCNTRRNGNLVEISFNSVWPGKSRSDCDYYKPWQFVVDDTSESCLELIRYALFNYINRSTERRTS